MFLRNVPELDSKENPEIRDVFSKRTLRMGTTATRRQSSPTDDLDDPEKPEKEEAMTVRSGHMRIRSHPGPGKPTF
jgi:hypothetical protein